MYKLSQFAPIWCSPTSLCCWLVLGLFWFSLIGSGRYSLAVIFTKTNLKSFSSHRIYEHPNRNIHAIFRTKAANNLCPVMQVIIIFANSICNFISPDNLYDKVSWEIVSCIRCTKKAAQVLHHLSLSPSLFRCLFVFASFGARVSVWLDALLNKVRNAIKKLIVFFFKCSHSILSFTSFQENEIETVLPSCCVCTVLKSPSTVPYSHFQLV